MPRNTDLATVLFPVELRPVGYEPAPTASRELRQSIGARDKELIDILADTDWETLLANQISLVA